MNSEIQQINVIESQKELQQAPLLNQSEVIVQDVRTSEGSATLMNQLPTHDTNDFQQVPVRAQPREFQELLEDKYVEVERAHPPIAASLELTLVGEEIMQNPEDQIMQPNPPELTPAAEPRQQDVIQQRPTTRPADQVQVQTSVFNSASQLTKILPNHRPRRISQQEMEEFGISSCRPVYVNADIYQACILNNLLPKGFRVEHQENILKAMLAREKLHKENQKKLDYLEKQKRKDEEKEEAKRAKLQQKEEAKRMQAKRDEDSYLKSLAATTQQAPAVVLEERVEAIIQTLEAQHKAEEQKSEQQIPLESSEVQKVSSPQPDLSKQPSRTSNRPKATVNYNSMLAGTSEVTNFDQQANNAAANAKLVQQKKNRKRNEDIFKLVNEFMFRIKESSLMQQLKSQFGHSDQDFLSILENIQRIEQNINEKYEGTEQLFTDLMADFSTPLMMFGMEKAQTLSGEFSKFQTLFKNEATAILRPNKLFYQVKPQKQPDYTAAQPKVSKSEEIRRVAEIEKQIQKLQQDLKVSATGAPRAPLTKPKPTVVEPRKDAPMTSSEKERLKHSISSLLPVQQTGIVKIVQAYCQKNNTSGVFEFELDQLPIDKLRELEAYVEQCQKENEKKKKRQEADAKRREQQKQQKQLAGMAVPVPAQTVIVQQQPILQQQRPVSQPVAPTTADPSQVAQGYNFEQMDAAQLSEILQTNPNINLSQQKRVEVESYRQQKLYQQQWPPTPILPGFPTQLTSQQQGQPYMQPNPNLLPFKPPTATQANEFSSSSSESEEDNFDYDKAKQNRYGASQSGYQAQPRRNN